MMERGGPVLLIPLADGSNALGPERKVAITIKSTKAR